MLSPLTELLKCLKGEKRKKKEGREADMNIDLTGNTITKPISVGRIMERLV